MPGATPNTRGLRSVKHAQVRRALFDAAMRLFREKGFDETSVDEVAAAAGFSRATFFNHFGSKSAVLRCYGESLQQRVEQALSTNDPESPPLERLRRLLLVMARDAEAHREDLKVVFAHSIHDVEYLARPTAARSRTLKLLAALIAEAQRLGHARRDLTAHEQGRQLLGLYNHALLTIVFGGRPASAAIDAVWRFAIGGIVHA